MEEVRAVEKALYYLKRRGSTFYASLLDPETGEHLSYRSTGETKEANAHLVVASWLKTGEVPKAPTACDKIIGIIKTHPLSDWEAGQITAELRQAGHENVAVLQGQDARKPLVGELRRFWDYDHSPYIQNRLIHGQSITQAWCAESRRIVEARWLPHFGEKDYREVTRQDLRDFGLSLVKGGTGPARANRILLTGTIAFGYWHREGLILRNPAERLEKFSAVPKERGILTLEEAETLFSRPWKDESARVANWVASLTGCRLGEILALRGQDIGEKVLDIRNSWNYKDQVIKSPKNGEARRVYLHGEVREALLGLLEENPHRDIPAEERFVFWGQCGEKPRYDGRPWLRALHEEMEAMGIDWKGRNICFHSWRHFFDSHSAAGGITIDQMKLALGHKTRAMTEIYAAHRNEEVLAEVGDKQRGIFGRVLQFKPRAKVLEEEDHAAGGLAV
jgi:integrase